MSSPFLHSFSLSQRPQVAVSASPCIPLHFLHHKISAGFPSPAADHSEDALDLNEYLVRNKPATFIFTVKGESMMNAGILDGDKVMVDRSLVPNNRDIVVAVVNGEYTIKRLYKRADRVELHPENPAYQPIVFCGDSELEIWGVVVGVVRRYGNQN